MHNPPVKLDDGKVRVALGDPDTTGLVLLTIAMNCFGDEVLGDPEAGIEPMDPAEIWAGLNERYGAWVTEEGENKLNALIMALQGDLFYRDVEVFQAVCQALPDGDLGDLLSDVFEDLTAADLMWGILEVELARDDEQGPPDFSDGVAEYITAVLAKEQEHHDEDAASIKEEYHRMLLQLQDIGVPRSALRLLDLEFVETMEVMENPAQL